MSNENINSQCFETKNIARRKFLETINNNKIYVGESHLAPWKKWWQSHAVIV